jgi:hypothetical protein
MWLIRTQINDGTFTEGTGQSHPRLVQPVQSEGCSYLRVNMCKICEVLFLKHWEYILTYSMVQDII